MLRGADSRCCHGCRWRVEGGGRSPQEGDISDRRARPCSYAQPAWADPLLAHTWPVGCLPYSALRGRRLSASGWFGKPGGRLSASAARTSSTRLEGFSLHLRWLRSCSHCPVRSPPPAPTCGCQPLVKPALEPPRLRLPPRLGASGRSWPPMRAGIELVGREGVGLAMLTAQQVTCSKRRSTAVRRMAGASDPTFDHGPRPTSYPPRFHASGGAR